MPVSKRRKNARKPAARSRNFYVVPLDGTPFRFRTDPPLSASPDRLEAEFPDGQDIERYIEFLRRMVVREDREKLEAAMLDAGVLDLLDFADQVLRRWRPPATKRWRQ